MSDETKHVTPSAPRQLDQNPAKGRFWLPRERVTRQPIERLHHLVDPGSLTVIDKLNEIIDRLNAMNEVM